ncbi:MAG TPA: DUF362 domain-containing protein [Blastocatellia bacterium]|nr:DUF362 domain-containing protein [Blastocatellia bacterium]
MSSTAKDARQDRRVAIAKLPEPVYSKGAAQAAIRRGATELGLAEDARGPLAGVIPDGARVLIKPNFVMHENQGPWGIEPLVTHPSIIRAAVVSALQAGASQVMVGDAPVQGCDFNLLMSATGLGEWAADLESVEPRFKGIHDFRRTTCVFVDGVRIASENLQDEDRFVLFDLGRESLLEPITDGKASFRVTCYDPRLMARTHGPGRHQYLVAKDVMEADVIINLPKLKTHKKAGVTCALKNLIGINGNKEFLPHHRAGGSASGGDCYPGASLVKRALEYSLDRQNQTDSFAGGRLWREVAVNLERISIRAGDDLGVEGSWSGNDTVWRTGLDLNRILLYGQKDAKLADHPRRRVFHIVDAVVAGQGDGPLKPEPLPLGLLFMGANAAAVDWVGARLLGYDPSQVSIVREAFADFRWPITSYAPGDVTLSGDFGAGNAEQILKEREAPAVIYPAGWRTAASAAEGN